MPPWRRSRSVRGGRLAAPHAARAQDRAAELRREPWSTPRRSSPHSRPPTWASRWKFAVWEAEYSALVIEWFAEAVDHLYGEVAPLGDGRARHADPRARRRRRRDHAVELPGADARGEARARAGQRQQRRPQAGRAVAAGGAAAGRAGHRGGPARRRASTSSRDSARWPARRSAVHMDVDALGFTGSTAVGPADDAVRRRLEPEEGVARAGREVAEPRARRRRRHRRRSPRTRRRASSATPARCATPARA